MFNDIYSQDWSLRLLRISISRLHYLHTFQEFSSLAPVESACNEIRKQYSRWGTEIIPAKTFLQS